MSTNTTDNTNKEEKTQPELNYRRISVDFVDSIFSQIKPSTDNKDPLNSTAKEFYSKQPQKTIQEQPQTPSKQNPNPEQTETSENAGNSENSEKKSKTNYKNKKIKEQKSSTPITKQKKIIIIIIINKKNCNLIIILQLKILKNQMNL